MGLLMAITKTESLFWNVALLIFFYLFLKNFFTLELSPLLLKRKNRIQGFLRLWKCKLHLIIT